MNTNTNPETGRPNFWDMPFPCPHNERAFDSTTVWCETCGATLTDGE